MRSSVRRNHSSPLGGEDLRNVDAGRMLDPLIGIDELTLEAARQRTADLLLPAPM